MPKATDQIRITFRMPIKTNEKLWAMASSKKKSINQLINEALDAWRPLQDGKKAAQCT